MTSRWAILALVTRRPRPRRAHRAGRHPAHAVSARLARAVARAGRALSSRGVPGRRRDGAPRRLADRPPRVSGSPSALGQLLVGAMIALAASSSEPGRPARAAGPRRLRIQRAESGDRKGGRGLVPAPRARHRDGRSSRPVSRWAGWPRRWRCRRSRWPGAGVTRSRRPVPCPFSRPRSSRSSTPPARPDAAGRREEGPRLRGARRVPPAPADSGGVRLRARALDRPVLSPRVSRALHEGDVRRLRGDGRSVPRAGAGGRHGEPRRVGSRVGSLLRRPPATGRRGQRGHRRRRLRRARARRPPPRSG